MFFTKYTSFSPSPNTTYPQTKPRLSENRAKLAWAMSSVRGLDEVKAPTTRSRLYSLDVYRSVTHTRCRSQCSQCCRQYRYHHLYNRFPCILFHDFFQFWILNFELRSVAFGEEKLRNYETMFGAYGESQLLQNSNLHPCGAAATPRNFTFLISPYSSGSLPLSTALHSWTRNCCSF
jgi:hypothetical protein